MAVTRIARAPMAYKASITWLTVLRGLMTRTATHAGSRNGEIVAKGNSSAVLGHPLNAVSWLARKVEGFGVRLRKGDVILPGTATRAIDISSGDHFVADFAGLGSVTLDFT